MHRALGLSLALMSLAACSGEVGTFEEGADAGVGTSDSGSTGLDASSAHPDAAISADAGAGHDASTCVDPCPMAGKKRCLSADSSKIDVCKQQADGCLRWITSSCPSGQSCMIMGSAMCM